MEPFLDREGQPYHPPAAPNGQVWGIPADGDERCVVFRLCDDGIEIRSAFFAWNDIAGTTYDDNTWTILCLSGDALRFQRGAPCVMLPDGQKTFATHHQGYPIPPCILVRIAREHGTT